MRSETVVLFLGNGLVLELLALMAWTLEWPIASLLALEGLLLMVVGIVLAVYHDKHMAERWRARYDV